MSGVAMSTILNRVFRANPTYELALFDRLPPEQQDLLKDLTDDPDFYGVLLPRTPGTLGIKSVCRETALLLHTMAQPGPLPRYVLHSMGDHAHQAVAKLVLDGVLEIEHEGRFVSSSEAYSLIDSSYAAPKPEGLLSRLSQAALEYAQALAIDDTAALSNRLYFYNRIPLTQRWSRRLRNEDAVSEFLGLSNSTTRKRVGRNWRRVGYSSPYNGWFQWESIRNRQVDRQRRHGYKLYVSPQPEELPAAFRTVVDVLSDSAAYAFKVGCDAIGLLRPDKLVIYFSDYERLEQTARELALRLSGCPAHGVPFTAAIGEDGLLSWGADPRPEKGILSWQGPESWRLWITNRLAVALISARSSASGTLQPWQFALERLRMENVDTATWAPTEGFGYPPI
jgi:hypothetical protein